MNQISLNPFAIARVLGAVACILVMASVAMQLTAYLTDNGLVYGLVKLFDLDRERNIPTAFSTLLLLIVAILLALIAVLKTRRRDSWACYWAFLSFGFLIMAADEAFYFHEQLAKPIRHLLGDKDLGVFYFAWVIPGMVLVLVLTLLFFRFWLNLSSKSRWTFLVAATLYVGGAIGFELIGGRFVEAHGRAHLMYTMLATVEETLEMGGLIVFIYALLNYITDNYKEVRFVFEEAHQREAKRDFEAFINAMPANKGVRT